MVVECCLSGVLCRRTMQEGLRGPKQLLTISNCLLEVARKSNTIIRVDKIIFEWILIVVFVWVRGSCSARHHGSHLFRQCRTISRFDDSCWIGYTACCKICCAIVQSPGLKAASSATCLRQPGKLNTRRVHCRRLTTVINLHMQPLQWQGKIPAYG